MFNLGLYFENSLVIPFIMQKSISGFHMPLLKNNNYGINSKDTECPTEIQKSYRERKPCRIC